MMHACGFDPRNDRSACRVEELAAESDWIDDGPEPDEPSPEQEREWDRRDDEIRGNAIGDRDWMLADLTAPHLDLDARLAAVTPGTAAWRPPRHEEEHLLD